jgi:hypothetical protein
MPKDIDEAEGAEPDRRQGTRLPDGVQPSITERLIALGWIWNKEGVLVSPRPSPRLKEDRDHIGSRYRR